MTLGITWLLLHETQRFFWVLFFTVSSEIFLPRGPWQGLRDADIVPFLWRDFGISHFFSTGLRDTISQRDAILVIFYIHQNLNVKPKTLLICPSTPICRTKFWEIQILRKTNEGEQYGKLSVWILKKLITNQQHSSFDYVFVQCCPMTRGD